MAVHPSNRRYALLAMATFGVVVGMVAAATAEKIELDKVPAKVKAAASKVAPKAQWKSASKQVEDGEVTYELKGENAAKRHVWVELGADEEIHEFGQEIGPEEVPPVVKTALKKWLPQFEVATTYAARHKGKIANYYFEGRWPLDKEESSVMISVNGKKIEIEEN